MNGIVAAGRFCPTAEAATWPRIPSEPRLVPTLSKNLRREVICDLSFVQAFPLWRIMRVVQPHFFAPSGFLGIRFC
jgi:hypothetical protein